jgi:hypothetical protein
MLLQVETLPHMQALLAKTSYAGGLPVARMLTLQRWRAPTAACTLGDWSPPDHSVPGSQPLWSPTDILYSSTNQAMGRMLLLVVQARFQCLYFL